MAKTATGGNFFFKMCVNVYHAWQYQKLSSLTHYSILHPFKLSSEKGQRPSYEYWIGKVKEK